MVRRGHKVTVIGVYWEEQGGGEEALDEGVRVVRVKRDGPPGLRFWMNRARLSRALGKLNDEMKIDVLEGGELDLADLRKDAPGVKVLRMHGGPHFFALPGRPGRLAVHKEKHAFAVADRLCAVSQYVADTTRRVLELGSRPIEVILNPVDLEMFQPGTPAEEVPGRIVFAGTITERKGIRELIAAMPLVLAEVPEASLEVYGGGLIGVSGPSLQEQLERSLPAEVRERVKWMGRVSRARLPEVLRQASVCVYPSYMEALPIAWLEGLASGRAVVASKLGPGPEVIEDGATGLLCDPKNPQELAAALVRVLKDRRLREQLGQAGRKSVEDRFSLQKLSARNELFYESISGGHSNKS